MPPLEAMACGCPVAVLRVGVAARGLRRRGRLLRPDVAGGHRPRRSRTCSTTRAVRRARPRAGAGVQLGRAARAHEAVYRRLAAGEITCGGRANTAKRLAPLEGRRDAPVYAERAARFEIQGGTLVVARRFRFATRASTASSACARCWRRSPRTISGRRARAAGRLRGRRLRGREGSSRRRSDSGSSTVAIAPAARRRTASAGAGRNRPASLLDDAAESRTPCSGRSAAVEAVALGGDRRRCAG